MFVGLYIYCLFVCLPFYNYAQLVPEARVVNMYYVEEDVLNTFTTTNVYIIMLFMVNSKPRN